MTLPAPPPAVVCDTDVMSFLFNRDAARGPRYAPHLRGRRVILPFAVVGEMLYGAEERNWGPARRMNLERFIRRYWIEYPTYAVCEIWAEIRVTARRLGHPI